MDITNLLNYYILTVKIYNKTYILYVMRKKMKRNIYILSTLQKLI